MKNKKFTLCGLPLAVATGMLMPHASIANAAGVQQGGPDLEEVVITGTRKKGRTALESTVPVDSFGQETLRNQGSSDMNEVLRALVPSYNAQAQPISDGSSFVRPATLRGLAPDHTLVLVNGKRRHRAALVYLNGSSGATSLGAQGPDISAIPSIALKSVEVLRDGAAAQYGSDAIAGVMNFLLRDNAEGLEVTAQYGRFYEGETDNKLSANLGLSLFNDGFINLSAEVSDAEETSRGTQRTDAQALIDAGNTAVADPAQVWGKPESESLRTFWNGAIPFAGGNELYFFGNYTSAESEGGFFYRNPETNSAFTDVPLDFENPAAGTFNFNSVYPGGFAPRFTGDLTDISQVIGFRGDWSADLNYDVSASYGNNEIEYGMSNSINASMGPDSPTSFEPGSLEQEEFNINFDLGYQLAENIHLAGGLEYREESYTISAGDLASYQIGRFARIVDGAGDPVINPVTGQPYSGLPIGSNGFQGFSPDQAGTFKRDNIAAYTDIEWDVSEDFLIGLALRFEDFSDFGSTTNSKVSARYNLTDTVILRGAVSTGFKAPTPGQANTTNVSTRFIDDSPTPVAVGTIPPTNPVAQFFGGEALDPETSTNISLGFVYTPTDEFTMTVDFYNIEVEDRIALSGNIEIGDDDILQLQAAGLDQASDFGRIRFFTNGFDTTTRGADVVAEYLWGETNFSLAYSYNSTEVDSFIPGVIDRLRLVELEDQLPEHKANLTVSRAINNWNLMARANYYGETVDAFGATSATDITAGSEVIVDLEVSYDFNESISVALGGTNIFDNYPDENPTRVSQGLPYFRESPIGFQGGMWYLRLTGRFE
jgi:iron complex outermembrane recepter protein